MLSVLIETRNDEDGLARTLASLVSAAVEGVVREVIVCDLGSTDHTHAVADQAGCAWIGEGGLAAGLVRAKSEWLLVLQPGSRLVEGWTESVEGHLMRSTAPARFTRDGENWLGSVMPRRRGLQQGLAVMRSEAAALIRAGGTERLERLRPLRLSGQISPAVGGGRR